MILKRNNTLKWYSREVLEGSGRISELRQEIPYFTTTPFCIEGAGVNKYLTLIVREPLRTCFKKQRMIPQCCGFVNPQRAVSQGRGWVSQLVGLGNQAPTIDLTRFPKYSENVPLNSGLRKKPSFEEKTRFQGK